MHADTTGTASSPRRPAAGLNRRDTVQPTGGPDSESPPSSESNASSSPPARRVRCASAAARAALRPVTRVNAGARG